MATNRVTTNNGNFDSDGNSSQTWIETTAAGANTFNIQDTAQSVSLSVRGASGDEVNIEAVSGEFQVKARGKIVTLVSDHQTIVINLASVVSKASAQSVTLNFLDGSIDLVKAANVNGLKLGGIALKNKFEDIAGTVNENDTTALDEFNEEIIPDPVPVTYTLTANAPVVTETDSGSTNLTFTLNLDKAPEESVTVNFQTLATGTATPGDDFDATAGVVTFAANQTVATVSIPVKGDTTFEANETVAVKFSGSKLTAEVTATGTINNNDVDPSTVVQTFTLTTGVDAVSGSANDDAISGLIGTSGTFTVGDNINGGSGTDTLNLIDASGVAAGFVSLNSVEVINVRTLVAGTANATTINAADWSGVESISNASSLENAVLSISGLDTSAHVHLIGHTDGLVSFNNTTTATDAITVGIENAGNFHNASVLTLAGTGVSSSFLNLDQNGSGLITSVNVELEGSNNLARLEAGSGVRTYTLSGSANAVLVTDDAITSFNASAAVGNIDISFSGASEVVAVGGAGNDTFRFGTTLSNSDSVDGGAGTDTVTLTMGAFSRNLNTSNVESATVVFNNDGGGTLSATGSTITAYNLATGTVGGDANFAGLLTNTTVNLTDGADALDAVSIDAASGASTMTINVGTASGSITFSGIAVTDVAAVTLTMAGGSTGNASLGVVSFDSDVKSVTISTTNSTGGDADLVIDDLQVAGATAVSITSNGSAAITLNAGMEQEPLVGLTVVANGSDAADVTFGDIGFSATPASLSIISLTANSGADIIPGDVSLGNGSTAAASGTVTLNAAGDGSIIGTSALDITTTGAYALNLNLAAGASGSVVLGDIAMFAGTASTAASAISLNVGAVTVGANGLVRINEINLNAATAGAQVVIGDITVGTSATFIFASGGISAGAIGNVDVSNINLTVGVDASATFGTISTLNGATGGAVGNIVVTVADSGSAAFGAISASAVGSISVSVSGDGGFDLGVLAVGSNVGAISVTLADEGDATFDNISAFGDVGAITIAGAVSATANFGTIEASSIGAITVSGAGFVDFGTISAVSLGGVDASQMTSGTFNIDLSAVTNAVEVSLGRANNTVISGVGNDVITLTNGTTGNDTIRYATATQGTDNVIGFGAGATGSDQIEFDVSELGSAANGDMVVIAAGDAVTLASQSAGTGFTFASNAEIMVLTTAYASTATMIADLASGSGTVTLSSGTFVSGQEILIAWSDGNDTLLSVGTVLTSGGVTMASGSLTVTDSTLAAIQGVTPGALVAANFEFV